MEVPHGVFAEGIYDHLEDKKPPPSREKRGVGSSRFFTHLCSPFIWKLVTGVFAEGIYDHRKDNNLLQVEKKGCRKQLFPLYEFSKNVPPPLITIPLKLGCTGLYGGKRGRCLSWRTRQREQWQATTDQSLVCHLYGSCSLVSLPRKYTITWSITTFSK